uniref:ApeA N-terminal domain-containing protein n=1 Tax=Candidatus Kentrum eta TaxID=2126337 RepID=A0A450UFH9_9GAMM|nr:MAG: hypothetical protein BECKH772A_GA0070896_1003014 [Candidatus Kentron sp. H]VFJ93944.1 MAG: hypothetical protein BECKH772B_GA0070898_100535 [Candidatus Kentron sp. H]VFJ99177.1 MAG: hypothetical protein BECKH772C_GA0070978_1002919 [Candidatus Kentron sp. H]
MTELFSEKRWTGEFFPPDAYEKRFCGEIQYSPEEGVVFSYAITGRDAPAATEVLHGVLSSGDRCTLVGRFQPYGGAGFSKKSDLVTGHTTLHGKAGFWYLAIGDFLAQDERFADIDFSLTNLQEFFYPGKNSVAYSEKPIYSVKTPFGRMEVGNTATFSLLYSDITSQIYTEDSAALDELIRAFEEIRAKYPDSYFSFKEDIAYRILLKFSPALTIRDAYEHVTSFANLFALLIYSPVHPESIHLRKPGPDGRSITIELYLSMVLDPRTIKVISAQNLFHYDMPITQSTAPFDAIVSAWLQAPHDHSPIVSSIQHETGFRTTHTAHGDIVLYATQLESITHGAGRKDKKYQYPLESHGSQRLRDGLMNSFGKSSLEETAVAIGELRNEIVHEGRPKHWLATLSLRQLIRIAQYLQLTIIGYLLTDIGVPVDAIAAYQDRYSPAA